MINGIGRHVDKDDHATHNKQSFFSFSIDIRLLGRAHIDLFTNKLMVDILYAHITLLNFLVGPC